MSLPPLCPTAIAVYVYRKTEPAASARVGRPAAPKKTAYEFLQILRSKKADGFEESWQTVYGGIEKKETAVEAALRELKEETHLKPARMFQVEFLETFYFRPEDCLLLMPVFAVEVPHSAKIKLNHEHTDHRWIPEKKIAGSFMWKTQIEALTQLLQQLRRPSPAMEFLEIKLP